MNRAFGEPLYDGAIRKHHHACTVIIPINRHEQS